MIFQASRNSFIGFVRLILVKVGADRFNGLQLLIGVRYEFDFCTYQRSVIADEDCCSHLCVIFQTTSKSVIVFVRLLFVMMADLLIMSQSDIEKSWLDRFNWP